ncbi:MAG: A/G-specific adenine glycosylase, partial [Deltaproteobacteria bacterium]|nr:A/G-specific adenine glycosylase [Deltaproteobacteria bacterium]
HHGRDLPWRKTDRPYEIVVSEIMLQQTQVARVIIKYREFIHAFPNVETLARASLRDVLSVWQGLGYNRRARSLKKLAEMVITEFQGEIPSDVRSLRKLPGIGNATAHAICAFAFNQPVVFVETNIRTVFIHHFFSDGTEVRDGEILPFVEQTLDRENSRRWYNALMDYGVVLKKQFQNPGKKSAHYQKQDPFEGSNRQIRGAILRMLMTRSRFTITELVAMVPFDAVSVRRNVKQLEEEGLLITEGTYVSIA